MDMVVELSDADAIKNPLCNNKVTNVMISERGVRRIGSAGGKKMLNMTLSDTME